MSQVSRAHNQKRKTSETKWYSLTIEDILKKLDSAKNGLALEKVRLRQKKYGPNRLPEAKTDSRFQIFIRQFKSSLVYVLLAASFASLFLHDLIDAGIIMLAVIINVIIGYYQENKAQNALSSLRKIVVNFSKVMRDGHEMQINTHELVPGDIVYLNSGDKIPADLRLIKVNNLKVNEAPLTGESAEVSKTNKAISGDLVLGDRQNMAFMGTQVTQGNAIGIVVATGSKTEIGKIAGLVAKTEDLVTPLQRRLQIFSKKISVMVLVISALIFTIGLLIGYDFTQIFITSIAVAVSAIPEGLLVAVTMILAVGMQKILKKKSLVKQLLAAEILGSTSVICTDKTGTLTEGEMKVVELNSHDFNVNLAGSDINKMETEELMLMLEIGMVCNNAYLENPEAELEHRIVRGSHTEKALFLAANNLGLEKEKLEKNYARLDEKPFDSEWKYMMTLNKYKSGNRVFMKGAPEVLLNKSQYIYTNSEKDKKIELNSQARKKMEETYLEMTGRGLRVLAVGYKDVPESVKNIKATKDESFFVFVGLIGIKDPIREEIKSTLKMVKSAGIKTVIITGDHKLTAMAIAKELGIPAEAKNVMSGEELAKITESELVKKVKDIHVYARVTPEDKLKIVKAWQDKGEVVAMTGDGINDAPALKKANIGIAVGSGTDVAKETADIILLDDNFKTIVAAVKEGRVIYDNIRKVILYFLSDSLAEIFIITVGLLTGWPLPLLASQIIWINLVDDTLPALSLTQEPADKNTMQRRPEKNNNMLDKERKLLTLLISFFSALGTLLFFWFYYYKQGASLEHARTMSFTFLAVSTLLYIFSIRSLSAPIWRTNIFKNKYMVGAVLIGFILQALAIYTPLLQTMFKTTAISFIDWFLIIFFCFVLIGIIELVKEFFTRNKIAKE